MFLLQNQSRSRRAFNALACVLVGLQLGAFFHVAAGDHVLCAEHGEWVDAHSDGLSGHAVAAPAGKEARLQSGTAVAAAGDHQHCTAFFHRRGAAPPVAAMARASAAVASEAIRPADLVAPHRSVLFVAPKQSPPARA
jgi:hypothetical protein